MTAFLPPNLIALFAPRDRIEFKAPIGELPHEKDRSKNPYSGIASFVQEFDPHSETPAKVRKIKWSASSQCSFRPNSTWHSIETTTIGKTHPTLPVEKYRGFSFYFQGSSRNPC